MDGGEEKAPFLKYADEYLEARRRRRRRRQRRQGGEQTREKARGKRKARRRGGTDDVSALERVERRRRAKRRPVPTKVDTEPAFVEYARSIAPHRVAEELNELMEWDSRIDAMLANLGGDEVEPTPEPASAPDLMSVPRSTNSVPPPVMRPARRIDWRSEAKAAGQAGNVYECMVFLSKLVTESRVAVPLVGSNGVTPLRAFVDATVDRQSHKQQLGHGARLRPTAVRELGGGGAWREGGADALAAALMLAYAKKKKGAKGEEWVDDVDGRQWLREEAVFLEAMRSNAFRGREMETIHRAILEDDDGNKRLPSQATNFIAAATTVGAALMDTVPVNAPREAPTPSLMRDNTLGPYIIKNMISVRKSDWYNGMAPVISASASTSK